MRTVRVFSVLEKKNLDVNPIKCRRAIDISAKIENFDSVVHSVSRCTWRSCLNEVPSDYHIRSWANGLIATICSRWRLTTLKKSIAYDAKHLNKILALNHGRFNERRHTASRYCWIIWHSYKLSNEHAPQLLLGIHVTIQASCRWLPDYIYNIYSAMKATHSVASTRRFCCFSNLSKVFPGHIIYYLYV